MRLVYVSYKAYLQAFQFEFSIADIKIDGKIAMAVVWLLTHRKTDNSIFYLWNFHLCFYGCWNGCWWRCGYCVLFSRINKHWSERKHYLSVRPTLGVIITVIVCVACAVPPKVFGKTPTKLWLRKSEFKTNGKTLNQCTN